MASLSKGRPEEIVVECWKKMFPGYCEDMDARRRGRGHGFIGRRLGKKTKRNYIS